MPAGKGSSNSETASKESSNSAQRTTFRPPWVKGGPDPLPAPQPKILKNTPRRDSNAATDSSATEKNNPLAGIQLRKTTIKTKEPQENGTKENTFVKPALKPVPQKEEKTVKKDHKLPIPKLNSVAERQLKDPPRKPSITDKDEEIDRAIPAARNALVRAESMRRLSQTPAPPPMPPPAPKMPPPPGFPEKTLTDQQKRKLDQLKSRPKNRPDWSGLLKEIESNKKLKHVVCNDRSQPLLPDTKSKEHFLYESEKQNAHNELLKQIQSGIHLKKVKTNDRSKPMLDGLRKFRRQMTIEEQIQKSMSMASIPPEEITPDEVDEMDDIDKVRDDLQSTKQMLALELRNKEAQERENKRLLARIQNLEAELEKERAKNKDGGGASGGKAGKTDADDKLVKSLKTEVEQARKTSEELEKKYTCTAEQLDITKTQLEEIKRQNQQLEKRLQEALQGKGGKLSLSDRKDSMANGDGSDLEFDDEESSEESDGEETEEKRKKKALKEVKHLRNKLRNFKYKQENAKKERAVLKDIIKKHQVAIKEEKKKYKELKKEVDKMAALMKDIDEEEEEEEDDDKTIEEEEVESEEESSEEETETESEDEESDESESEPEDAPLEKQKANLAKRADRHETLLSTLKKANFMFKTNAERLQDELNRQKEMTLALKEELDSVLSELG